MIRMVTRSLLSVFSLFIFCFSSTAIATEQQGFLLAMADDGHYAGKSTAENKSHEDDDEDEGKSKDKRGKKDGSKKSGKSSLKHGAGYSVLLPVSNEVYRQECTSCHFAYLPGLLPAASWRGLLSTLDDHYGENASIEDGKTLNELLTFLEAYAADQSRAKLSVRIMRDLKDKETPAAVSDIRYIRRQHHEIPKRMIKDNRQVRTLANCIACHAGAERGVFNEDDVKIPGYGYWED